MHGTSPFIDTAAVEAWDAWFRWREPDRLRDLSIEATWQRAVTALTSSASMRSRAMELMDACSSWRLLLDERILATAGTPIANWPDDGLVAAINVPMFVRRRFSSQGDINMMGLKQVAALAVCALDGAMPPRESREGLHLRIGVMGMADALAFLGLHYGSAAACRLVGQVCRAVGEGCFEESIRLARDHGARVTPNEHRLEQASERGFSIELVRDAGRYGLRHARLTAITSQPRLALLANNVADALDPLLGENHIHRISASGGTRSVCSSGYALTVNRTPISHQQISIDSSARSEIHAQLEMRAAAQAWIDEPITYPLTVARAPSNEDWQSAQRIALACGLESPDWRLFDSHIAPIEAQTTEQFA